LGGLLGFSFGAGGANLIKKKERQTPTGTVSTHPSNPNSVNAIVVNCKKEYM
jgi:hypothetical protein